MMTGQEFRARARFMMRRARQRHGHLVALFYCNLSWWPVHCPGGEESPPPCNDNNAA